jgi:outer membrane protein TolC
VLTAYQNVADSLHALVSDADELSAALAAERAARVALDLTQQQLSNGYTDYLNTLAAQISYQQALLTLVQAQSTRFGDTAALYQSLGGGWWNRAATLVASDGTPARR